MPCDAPSSAHCCEGGGGRPSRGPARPGPVGPRGMERGDRDQSETSLARHRAWSVHPCYDTTTHSSPCSATVRSAASRVGLDVNAPQPFSNATARTLLTKGKSWTLRLIGQQTRKPSAHWLTKPRPCQIALGGTSPGTWRGNSHGEHGLDEHHSRSSAINETFLIFPINF